MNHFIVLICFAVFREAAGSSPSAADSSSGFKVKRSLPARQLLVGYWGQNSIGRKVSRQYWEKDLRYFCNNHKFDIYLVAFVHRLFRNNQNRDGIPGMNFAHHCSYAPNTQNPSVFECATIGGGIRDCQKLGKKILISLGGDTCDGTLESAENAKKLAYYIWHMFLGGKDMQDKRPFLWTVMDGVDLDIEIGSHKYYPDFVREMRRLMNTDKSKQYLITAAPQCPFPDKWMGPQKQGSALEEYGNEFDYLFIQFYNNYCYPGDIYFLPVMDTWLKWTRSIPNGPLIVLGLPAGPEAAGKPHFYFPPDKLATVYKQIRNKPGVGGLMFWDCSWVQNNNVNDKNYGTYAFDLLRGITTPPTQVPTTHAPQTTQSTTTGKPTMSQTTKPPTQSPVTTIKPPTGPVDCSVDGYYPDPVDCSKFIVCSAGVAFSRVCPPGLKYNKANKYCDWPQNVQC